MAGPYSTYNDMCLLATFLMPFTLGLVTGFQAARLPKLRALEWFAVPAVASAGAAIIMPHLLFVILAGWGAFMIGMLVAFSLAAASGRGMFDEYRRGNLP